MFSSLLRGLLVEGFEFTPLLFVFFVIVTSQLCVVYSFCSNGGLMCRIDVLTAGTLMCSQVLFCGYCLLVESLDTLLELIGFSAVQVSCCH